VDLDTFIVATYCLIDELMDEHLSGGRGRLRERGPRPTSDDHLGKPYNRRYELRDQPGAQYEAEVAEDVLYLLHALADQSYELLRQSSPAQVIYAVSAHDFLAPPPLFLGQLQVIV
jgi:hypothetical protein